jgi:hypothetical protein
MTNSASRGPIEEAIVAIWAKARVQDNGDGTWSAVCDYGGRTTPLALGASREEALGMAADLASVALPESQAGGGNDDDD